MSKLKEYHFNCGNSSTGPVGMCAVVRASSKEEAAELLTELMPECVNVKIDHPSVVYCNVYFGTAKARHIDAIDPASADGAPFRIVYVNQKGRKVAHIVERKPIRGAWS